jgi:peroxiredoxin
MRLILFFLAASFFIACGASPGDNRTTANASATMHAGPRDFGPAEVPDIKIQVEGLTGGTAYLIGVYTDQNYRVDSAIINSSGEMHFKRKEPYQQGLVFLILPNQNVTPQILLGTDQTFAMKTKLPDLIGSMQVEGSLDNDLLYQGFRFENEQKPKYDQLAQTMRTVPLNSPQYKEYRKQYDQLIADRKAFLEGIFTKHPDALYTHFKRAGQNPDIQEVKKPDGTIDTARQTWLYRSEFWNGVDFSDARLLYTPVIANKLKRYIDELTPQNADSIIASSKLLVDKSLNYPEYFKYFSNWITIHYDPKETTLMDPQAVFVYMIQNYFTYDKAFWSDSVEVHALQLRAFEMQASLVGKKGPDVQAKDPTGRMRSIYEMKAPYIVVYMYNPDCEHCAEQTPILVRSHQAWKSKGIEIFGIAIDTNDKEWKDYIAKQGIQWTTVHDPTNKSIYAKYFVDVTPEVYILNPDRIIIGKNLHVDQVMTVIERDMKKRR